MAQTNFTPISLYYSTTAAAVPVNTNLVNGELAINITDGKLYYKNNGGTVTLLASTAGASGDVVGPASATDNALTRFDATTGKLIQNSVGILSDAGVLTGLTGITSSGSITFSSLTSGRVTYATTSGLLTDSANLLFNGTTLTANTLNLTNALGTTYGGTGLTSFTANGVVYASSSSALTTGSALTFDGSNLGIGTTSPGATLDVNGATRIRSNFYVYGTGDRFNVLPQAAGSGAWLVSTNNANSAYSQLLFDGSPLVFNVAGTEQMRLTSTGLGIGTSSPTATLDVRGTLYQQVSSNPTNAVAAIITNQTTVSNTGVRLQFDVYNIGSSGLGVPSDSAALAFYSGGITTERARIDSSGNLGIGTTSPSASAILDAQSTTKGVRMPNMTTTQKNAISSPAAGLMVFDTTLAKLCVYSGSAWQTITSV